MANYKLDNFVIPATTEDKKIQIRDKRGVIRFTISAHQVVATFQTGNLVKIRTRANDNVITLDFSIPGEALAALQKLQNEIDKVRLSTPISIDKDIQNYVDSIAGSSSNTYFLYHQVATASTWLITHNLGLRPNVMVTDDSFYEIEGLVRHIDINNTTIYFNQNISGWVIAS